MPIFIYFYSIITYNFNYRFILIYIIQCTYINFHELYTPYRMIIFVWENENMASWTTVTVHQFSISIIMTCIFNDITCICFDAKRPFSFLFLSYLLQVSYSTKYVPSLFACSYLTWILFFLNCSLEFTLLC